MKPGFGEDNTTDQTDVIRHATIDGSARLLGRSGLGAEQST